VPETLFHRNLFPTTGVDPRKEPLMPISDENDDTVVRLVRETAQKYKATIKKIDLDKQILDIQCPDENKDECAVAIQKILEKHFPSS
jgi:hypothetical protein